MFMFYLYGYVCHTPIGSSPMGDPLCVVGVLCDLPSGSTCGLEEFLSTVTFILFICGRHSYQTPLTQKMLKRSKYNWLSCSTFIIIF